MDGAFRSEVESDIEKVFTNLDDFGETHLVDGKETACVIAPDERIQLAKGYALGVAEASLTLYAKQGDLPKRMEAGEKLTVDHKIYSVVRWSEHMGMAEVVLTQNRSR
jgi:hypothetical protein